MNNVVPHAILFLAVLPFVFVESYAQGRIELQRKYWVFFTDKGPGTVEQLAPQSAVWQQAQKLHSPRALERRAKVLPPESLLDAADLPLFQPYIDSIKRIGGVFHQQSRWLNAASFSLPPGTREAVASLPFVERLRPVLVFQRERESLSFADFLTRAKTLGLDYGPSFAQVDMIRATQVHKLGITGEGVIVGMLDTGYRWRVHEALRNARVIAEWDFIQNDSITANQPGDSPNQDQHGTLTMSVLGGFKEGQLIGPAFGVQFLLAKTEYVPTETRIEEDNWVAGIEWAESNGADVVTSSLGYNVFDDGFAYRWENGDFDGRTAVTTLAAIRAARLGVVVCTAMGNEGNGNGVRGTMLTPADADSILSVGAVSLQRRLAAFSSTGPTNDGRIKPEVVAPGVSIYCALPGESSYAFIQGTSLSTPLTAASAALILSARPDLTAQQVRDALRFTADTVDVARFGVVPNNFTGWGLVDARKAISYPTLAFTGSANRIAAFLGSPNGLLDGSAKLLYRTGDGELRSLPMTRYMGPANTTNGSYRADVAGLASNSLVWFSIEAFDSLGKQIRIPEDSTKEFSFAFGSQTLHPPSVVVPIVSRLYQNYPNPFNAITFIEFTMPSSVHVEITAYNLLGQRIATLFNTQCSVGRNVVTWNGTNQQGIPVASGLYFYSLRSPLFSEVKKMMLIR